MLLLLGIMGRIQHSIEASSRAEALLSKEHPDSPAEWRTRLSHTKRKAAAQEKADQEEKVGSCSQKGNWAPGIIGQKG